MMFWSRRYRRLYTARARSEQLRALVAIWGVILSYFAIMARRRGRSEDIAVTR